MLEEKQVKDMMTHPDYVNDENVQKLCNDWLRLNTMTGNLIDAVGQKPRPINVTLAR